MSLPNAWVDRLFARLLVRYGSAWMRMWEGIDESLVKADWASELDKVPPHAIAYGLEHLPPDRPPTAPLFKALCLNAPPPPVKRLPAPKPDLARIASEFAKLRHPRSDGRPLAWAYDLQERETRGEALTPAQRAAWREALAHMPITGSGALLSEFRPIPSEMLPPAMRGACS